MEDNIAARLIQLNAEFYQTFAVQFSATRGRIQPGVRRILETIDPEANILDLGCGNGELARDLADQGYRGSYLGLDFSKELLGVARPGVAGYSNFNFAQANLANSDWQLSVVSDQSSVSSGEWGVVSGAQTFNIQRSTFNVILAFATLHHLPGKETHLQILRTVRNLLTPAGRFIHSNWQFLSSERLRARIQLIPGTTYSIGDAAEPDTAMSTTSTKMSYLPWQQRLVSALLRLFIQTEKLEI